MVKRDARLTFVANKSDVDALRCLQLLREHGYATTILSDGEFAPVGSVALYTGHNQHYPSKHLRMAAHRIMDGRPKWACTTPLVASIKANRPEDTRGLETAIVQLADAYIRWMRGEWGALVPWSPPGEVATTYAEMFEVWLDAAEEALGPETMNLIVSSKHVPSHLRGRGGDVVFNNIHPTGHVVTTRGKLPSGTPTNTAYQMLTGLEGVIASYGTSDAANIFEFMQLLKMAHVLGLPAVFETYPTAHNLRYWLDGFLNPSLKLYRTSVNAEDFGLSADAKYTAILSKAQCALLASRAGLDYAAGEMVASADTSIAMWYQAGMREVAKRVLALLHLNVPFAFTTTEDMARATGLWSTRADEYAAGLEKLMGHPVVAINQAEGVQRRSSDGGWGNATIGSLHDQGQWLGGAGIYDLVFGMSLYGGVVVMVKDSTAGRVNNVALKYIESGAPLYVCPVGLFRLSGQEQNEDWAIDPWVFLDLLKRWGTSKAREVVTQLWQAMEVPLDQANIGRKTVATVGFDGITITTSSAR